MIVMAKKWGYQPKVCGCRPIIDLFYMYQVFCLHDGIILSVSLWVQKVINSIFSGLMSLRVRLYEIEVAIAKLSESCFVVGRLSGFH